VTSIVLLAGGIVVLGWTIRQLDLRPADIQTGLSNVGWWFVAILLVSFARFVLRARAWVALTGLPLPIGPAVAATISGDALGNVTPLGLVASEPSKALYLRRHADPGHTLAALVAENFFYSVSVALVILAGTLTLLATFVLPDAWRNAAWLALALMGSVLVVATWLAWKRPGVSTRFSFNEHRWYGRALGKVRVLEQIAYRGLRASPWRVLVVISCELAFHALSIIESWLILYLLTGSSQWLNAFLFDTLNRVINVVFRVVPLKVGVDEVSASGLADLIGLGSATGLTMALVRKARVLVWAAVGLGLTGRRALRRG
jgi:hypothetical protein